MESYKIRDYLTTGGGVTKSKKTFFHYHNGDVLEGYFFDIDQNMDDSMTSNTWNYRNDKNEMNTVNGADIKNLKS